MKIAPASLLVLTVTLAGCVELGPKKKVVVIGIDGVRPDVLAQVATPQIDRLIAGGYYADSVMTRAQTISGAGWSSMLTGVWPEKHGVTSNDLSTNNYAAYPDFLSRIELVKEELNTIAIVDWPPLGTSASGGPLLSDSIDAKLNFDGDVLGYAEADSQSVAAAARYLRNQDPDALFVYIGYPDVAAHEHGGLSESYLEAIEAADAQIRRLLQAISERATVDREDWLILISTDHGHRDAGGHGGGSPEERRVFYLASGAGVRARAPGEAANLVDVAATAMAHLGIRIDPDWGLDGRVVGLRE